jgi:hypothetical protein
MRTLLLLLALALASLPGPLLAQGDDAPPAEATATTDEAVEEVPEAPVDKLTLRMQELVDRYYQGISAEPTDQELADGVQAIQLMLLDGVSLGRIDAAVSEAIRLHTPGRRIPFPIAVPLRVRPADPGEATRDRAGTPDPNPEARKGTARPALDLDPAVEERRSELRRKREERQQRKRLYRQWQERLKERRVLLSLGIPMLASGYAIGFVVGGVMSQTGEVPYYSAWVTAVPVVGALILGIWTEGSMPPLFILSGLQMGGVALIIASIAKKIDWPYDEDPTALRIGKRRDGRAALTLFPTGTGVVGVF